jgi:phospholipid/cholesterol/gamma-HCH transport system ATP-binding protein
LTIMDAPARHAERMPVISLRDVTLCNGGRAIQRHLSFDVRRGSIFAIMGASGAGKSTALRSMIGLLPPASGVMLVGCRDYWAASDSERARMGRRFGVLFQSGALWSSLTVGENVALPMQMLTDMDASSIHRMVELKLALVGLKDASDFWPEQLSGGMVKRAGLARALALDPDLLFLDEPSSGLDPVSARHLDDLILDLRDTLHTTIVIVSHDLANLFATADDGIFLDGETRTAIARGSPAWLRDRCEDPRVQAFMRRGETVTARVREVV